MLTKPFKVRSVIAPKCNTSCHEAKKIADFKSYSVLNDRIHKVSLARSIWPQRAVLQACYTRNFHLEPSLSSDMWRKAFCWKKESFYKTVLGRVFFSSSSFWQTFFFCLFLQKSLFFSKGKFLTCDCERKKKKKAKPISSILLRIAHFCPIKWYTSLNLKYILWRRKDFRKEIWHWQKSKLNSDFKGKLVMTFGLWNTLTKKYMKWMSLYLFKIGHFLDIIMTVHNV